MYRFGFYVSLLRPASPATNNIVHYTGWARSPCAPVPDGCCIVLEMVRGPCVKRCMWHTWPLVVKTQQNYCTVVAKYVDYNYMFRPFSRPSSGCICLALRVLYNDVKLDYLDDEISIILTCALFILFILTEWSKSTEGSIHTPAL
jgi:hypothetical protein